MLQSSKLCSSLGSLDQSRLFTSIDHDQIVDGPCDEKRESYLELNLFVRFVEVNRLSVRDEEGGDDDGEEDGAAAASSSCS